MSGRNYGDQRRQGDSGGNQNDDIKTALTSQKTITYRKDGHVRPALLDADAQAQAKDLANVSTTQLRRFFEQAGAIKRRDELHELSDDEVLAQVAFVKASAAYAAGREGKNKPLLEFVVLHANSIKGRQDFLYFHWHFQAVIAFHKVYGENKKGN